MESQFCPTDGSPLGDAAPMEPTGDLPVGMLVGEYRVTGKIGEGGMGTVYAGVHPVIGKKVALKLLNPALAADPATVARFVSEARSVNHIQHPNIVDIFSFGQLPDGRHFFVMELLEGRTLKEEIERQALMPPTLALHVLWQVCDALEAAHARGIFHRDLKPDNVFLVERATVGVFVKLLDFGIAKLTGEAGRGLSQTRTGIPMGTPFYMSPEQCRGTGVDHRTDIYSLGVMMYEVFTGKLPFTGNSYIDVIQAQIATPPRPPAEIAPVPEALSQVILHAMAKDPAERHQSATEFKRDLERLARDAGSPLAVVPTTGPVTDLPTITPGHAPVSVQTPSFAVPGKTVSAPTKRKSIIPAVLGGIGVAAAVVVGVVALRGRGATPPPAAVPPAVAQPVPATAASAPAAVVPPPPPAPAVAKLAVEVTPAATLSIEGAVRGTGARFDLEVAPGSHELVLEAAGYETYRETVALTAGAALNRVVTLEKSAKLVRRPGRHGRAAPPAGTAAPAAPAQTGDATLDPFK
jgi:eukaryotic-like serine/threonine-protein kinase